MKSDTVVLKEKALGVLAAIPLIAGLAFMSWHEVSGMERGILGCLILSAAFVIAYALTGFGSREYWLPRAAICTVIGAAGQCTPFANSAFLMWWCLAAAIFWGGFAHSQRQCKSIDYSGHEKLGWLASALLCTIVGLGGSCTPFCIAAGIFWILAIVRSKPASSPRQQVPVDDGRYEAAIRYLESDRFNDDLDRVIYSRHR